MDTTQKRVALFIIGLSVVMWLRKHNCCTVIFVLLLAALAFSYTMEHLY
ncbi:TPA: hypothetical protein PXF07_002470 [Mannheimia haemolytica]|nr:hypothetical protein [Mannheimia haemolytica]AGK01993.1 hypothetical protein MHH_c15420 [Mannheimia haemolytica M42548]EDN73580.1 hypothetical protein MHA_0615 [Mannheimia haemolytica PHL213]MBF4101908.1 hypothetical protein [Mannheimia haemolytica]MCB4228086.1 hypothetical protein [Mannheimia haemolytica]MDQ6539055.1 hypothetical protein [Mannheimia haemolytica]